MVEDTPDDIVFEVHGETLWGDHPYGYSILGTPETVQALHGCDLRALHRAPIARARRGGRRRQRDARAVARDAHGDTGWADLKGERAAGTDGDSAGRRRPAGREARWSAISTRCIW
jgi:hypothetical protein